jgi:hypothetical protein
MPRTLCKHDPNQALPFYQAHFSAPLSQQQPIAAKPGTSIQYAPALKLDTTCPHQVRENPAVGAPLNFRISRLIRLCIAWRAKPHASMIKIQRRLANSGRCRYRYQLAPSLIAPRILGQLRPVIEHNLIVSHWLLAT